MAEVAGNNNKPAKMKTCLCGNIVSSQSSTLIGKCGICRTKPKFVRTHEAFGQVYQVVELHGSTDSIGSDYELQATTRPRSSRNSSIVRPRRAHSAERYDGLRLQRSGQPSLELYLVRAGTGCRHPETRSPPPQYSPALPITNDIEDTSPPPTYEEAESSSVLSPPSYEDSVGERKKSGGIKQHSACSCSKCQVNNRHNSRIAARASNELRVALPPEETTTQYLRSPGAGALSPSSHNQCSCCKCQSRYSSNEQMSRDNNELLLTLEAQTAMQGVLTDGIVLCSLV